MALIDPVAVGAMQVVQLPAQEGMLHFEVVVDGRQEQQAEQPHLQMDEEPLKQQRNH